VEKRVNCTCLICFCSFSGCAGSNLTTSLFCLQFFSFFCFCLFFCFVAQFDFCTSYLSPPSFVTGFYRHYSCMGMNFSVYWPMNVFLVASGKYKLWKTVHLYKRRPCFISKRLKQNNNSRIFLEVSFAACNRWDFIRKQLEQLVLSAW